MSGRTRVPRRSLTTRVGIVVVLLGAVLSAAVLYIPLSQRSVEDRQAALDRVGQEAAIALGLLAAEQRSLVTFAIEAARAAVSASDLSGLATTLSAVTSPGDVVAVVSPSSTGVASGGSAVTPSAWLWLSAAARTAQTIVSDTSGDGWLVGSAPVGGLVSTFTAVGRALTRTQLATLAASSAAAGANGFAVVRGGRYALAGAVAGRPVADGASVDPSLSQLDAGRSTVISIAGEDCAAGVQDLGAGYRLLVTAAVAGARPLGDDIPVVAVTVLLVLLAVAVVYALVRRDLERPLTSLDGALAALGREDFDAPLARTGDDTVDAVTASFLAMRAELRTVLRTADARAEIAHDLASASSLEGALLDVCRRLRGATGARLALVVLAAHNGRAASLHAAGSPQPEAAQPLLDDGGVLATAYTNARHGAVLACPVHGGDVGMRYEEVCAAALRVGSRCHGVLAVAGAERAGAFGPHTLALVEAAAEQVAFAVERERVLVTARLQASTDDLTGLYNRRFVTDFLEQQLAIADRASAVLSVLMLDVDHFKAINDELGHEAGDAALRAVARTLIGTLRRSDLAARLGGDEFLVVMSDTSMEAAAGVAEKLRRAIAGASVDAPTTRRSAQMTVSIGVASRAPGGPGVDGILTIVDDALYDAKRRGRDRVAIARRPATETRAAGADVRRDPPCAGRSSEPGARDDEGQQ